MQVCTDLHILSDKSVVSRLSFFSDILYKTWRMSAPKECKSGHLQKASKF